MTKCLKYNIEYILFPSGFAITILVRMTATPNESAIFKSALKNFAMAICLFASSARPE